MRYYRHFWIFMNNPLAGKYLRWAYQKGIDDLSVLNFRPNFNKENFTCLLCGVANEKTANEFIKFTITKNPKAKFWIIDIGDEQLRAVTKLVKKKYPHLDIHIEKINALELDRIISPESLDWIETDGFLEFFDNNGLDKLFKVWFTLLKPDGFITTRDYATSRKLYRAYDTLRIWQMRIWLGVKIFAHSPEDFAKLFKKYNLRVAEGPTFIPTYKRFAIIKSKTT